jgi:hypothetical protein
MVFNFSRPEIFQVVCDVHSWMKAWIVVVEHPYYSLTDSSGKFELKLPMNDPLEKRVSDQYRELDVEDDILAYFGARHIPMKDFVVEKGYQSFCMITTTRKKYKKDGFGIDLDSMDFGYTLAEIEYMTDDKSKRQEATQSMDITSRNRTKVAAGLASLGGLEQKMGEA